MSANERSVVQQTIAEVAADLGRTTRRPKQPPGPAQRRCARCDANLGRFYNTGAACPRCRLRVCRHCREHRGDDWLCSLCHKIQDLRSVSAEWRRTTGRDNYLSALDILKYSIRRAWTINGPPARWSASRKSAEYRLYRSLPNTRRRDFLEEKNFKNIVKRSSAEPLTIKPPKVIAKAKPIDTPKKSSIPVFRSRNSREFEDLRSPHESPKRSLIPQRYRNSTDDLRRSSREDISLPSFIPKLLSPVRADKLKRQDSRDDVRSPSAKQNPQEIKPTGGFKSFLKREDQNCDSATFRIYSESLLFDIESTRQECTSPSQFVASPEAQPTMKMPREPVGDNCDETKVGGGGTLDEIDKALQIPRVNDFRNQVDRKNDGNSEELTENDKQKTAKETGKKIDDAPPVIKRKFSKEEFSNDDTDDTANRRCSSHFSPEASPLSTRSSKYSPRESESEPTPALPRKVITERGESSLASQRIRDAITRTRRESNSSAKYESSGSESVSRLGESGLSSYVDIARRVKLFGSGSIGASTGSYDEILQRDSATSAGEDEHDDHARDPMRMGLNSQRVMLRRRRQFDTQGPRRRGRSRACCGVEDHHHLQGLHQVVDEDHLLAGAGGPALLDYRRLVFISSDSSSGREEDDADSSCSGSSYLNLAGQTTPGGCGLEDCDWDYFESNSLKLPQLQPVSPAQQHDHRSLSCCPARPSASSASCCQTCGGSKNAKVLPVPVPIPVPVPYPVPVPASLWTGDMTGRAAAAAANSIISRDAVAQSALSLRAAGCDPSTGWFTWNPKFDSTPNLLFAQSNIFPGELSSSADDLLKQEKAEKPENRENIESGIQSEKVPNDSLPDDPETPPQEENDPDQKNQPRMFHQNQDSRSSSGRSSADSSDLEDSAASHRFSRVMIVNDDSLTSDNDIEDNEDSDSARENQPATLKQNDFLPENSEDKESNEDAVVLKKIRHFEEDSYLIEDKSDKLYPATEDENSEQSCDKKPQSEFSANNDEIASYDEIYLASNQEDSENIVLLKSVKSIDPENYGQADDSFVPGFKAFPKELKGKDPEIVLASNVCNNDQDDDDSSDDSAVMPDSLEVSMQDLEDSIEVAGNTSPTSTLACDIGRALLAASSPVEGKSNNLRSPDNQEEEEEEEEATSPTVEREEEKLTTTASSSPSSSGALTSTTSSSSDELHEYSVSCTQAQEAAYMAKSRKKWQIPASFDIKGLPSTHFLPPERKKDTSHSLSPLLSAAEDVQLQPEEDILSVQENLQDEENANGYQEHEYEVQEENERGRDESSSSYSSGSERVRGSAAKQVGVNERLLLPPPSQPRRTPTNNDALATTVDEDDEEEEDEEAMLPPLPSGRRDWANNLCSLSQLNNINNNTNGAAAASAAAAAAAAQLGNNKYRSLVMITQGGYQPVNVITSDTTTLMQPQQVAGAYYQRNAESGQDAARRNLSQGLNKKPLPCKRLLPEPEVDSGLSVGSASESDDVSVKNAASKQASRSPNLLINREDEALQDYPSFESTSQKRAGPLILEEGLADDDSWVEEISHDEDEASMTTATEESSEDEAANNLGDREEELRGYHRQAIDFTLHTIVEESCEESESEHASASWRRRLASASAPDLNRYLFFGVGADGNSSRELDSLSETSSIMSEGLDSLTREEHSQNSGIAENGNSEGSKRQEKSYFLSDFLGADQDRRDSDGSVGSDSEGRPSPEAQRRKRLVRARGTGRSHSSSLDNLLALTHNNSNSGSHQNSLQDISHPGTDGQESQSEGSSTETDAADENQSSSAFGPEGQFDTVKRKKKKLRSLGAQSPRVNEDRNKTPEISEMPDEDDTNGNSDEDGAKTPQPENVLSSSLAESVQSIQDELSTSSASSKQQSRDSGFVGSCDDLLLQPQRNASENRTLNEASSGILDARDIVQTKDYNQARDKDKLNGQIKLTPEEKNIHGRLLESHRLRERLAPNTGGSLTRKDSFNNWSSDEETNLMMSKMRQFFKTMVANSNNVNQTGSTASSVASPAPSPSPRLSGYSSKTRNYVQAQNRTKPPQLVYFENELTRLMKTVPGIRDEQVREIVEYLSSEDTWSDSYDSSDYTSSDLEGATAGGRRSALQEQISASCQQIISKFDTSATNTAEDRILPNRRDVPIKPNTQQNMGRDTAFVYQKLVQSFTKMAGDNVTSDASSTPHSSPPLIAKVMHHIGSRLVALMHEVSESNSTGGHSHSSAGWRRYPHHRTPSSASTTEDDDSTSDSASAPTLPRSKSHDPILHLNGHTGAASMPPAESEERGEASDYERFSWRGSFESALMAADSRTKLSLLACSGGDVSSSTMAMAAKRRSAGDLLFNHKSFSREQLDRVRSCGSIGGAGGTGNVSVGGSAGGSIEEKIWSNRRRSSVPDANTRGDEDTGDDSEDLEYANHGDPRATTLPRGMNPTGAASPSTTNSLPRQTGSSAAAMLKAHNTHHFTQHNAVKSARYRPPGFTRNSPGTLAAAAAGAGPKRAFSAPGLQLQSRSRRQQMANTSATSSNNLSNTSGSADEASLSEACSTPIIGASSRIANSSHASMDLDEIDRNLHLATRASLSSLGARSDSMASVYSGAGEGRWCGSVAVRGEVEFSLQYDYKQLTLEVHVTQCKDLAPVDVKRNRSDPYVKVYLLPDKSKSGKRKTKVKKHTLNPVFDETLKFHTSINSLETRTLWLTVWHSDMFGRNDFLGEVRMPLENKIFDDPRPQWYPLQERTEPFDDPVAYKGEVIVGLKFVPPDPTRQDRDRDTLSLTNKLKKSLSKGSLHVLVKEARNLQTRAKNSGTCDPFCKSYLLPDKGRSGKQKTGVVRRSTGSPVWNHTFVYKDVSLQELAERGLELTVWDHDRIASNEFLGGVRFNLGTGKHYGKGVDWMDATGREMSLWQSMLERPNFWVEGAVTLRPNLHNHGKPGTS